MSDIKELAKRGSALLRELNEAAGFSQATSAPIVPPVNKMDLANCSDCAKVKELQRQIAELKRAVKCLEEENGGESLSHAFVRGMRGEH